MSETFSLATSRYDSMDDPALVAEIRRHTGSDRAVARILRSIDRFGHDATIARYEITPRVRGRSTASADTMAWAVRAIRS